MPSSVQEELDRIYRKFIRCEYQEILDDLDKVLENEEITKEERIKAKILQSHAYRFLYRLLAEGGSKEIADKLAQEVIEESENLGDNYLIVASNLNLTSIYFEDNKWQEYQKLIKEVLISFEELEPRTELFYLGLKARILIHKGLILYIKTYVGESLSDEEREEAYQYWTEGEKFCGINNLYFPQITCLGNISTVHYYRGELDLALETSQKSVAIAKELGNKILIGLTLYSLAETYYEKGDYKRFYEITKERLLIYEELEDKRFVAGTLSQLGQYYSIIGEYDEALENYESSLEVAKNLKRENWTAFLQQNIGYVYFLKGEFEKALEFYGKAYPVLKENQPQSWFSILSDLAKINVQKGELDEALEYLDQLMTIHEGFQNQIGISDVLSEQGVIYWQKGMKEQALSSMQDGLEIRKKIDNKDLIVTSLSYLIQFNVELNNLEGARKYFESLVLINKETKIKQVSQNYKFSEALILKTSSDLRDRLKAEVLFEQLIEEDISYSLLVQVLLNLCDLLILEMKETNDPKVLEKIYKNVNKLQEMAEKNNSHLLQVETIRMNAQLALLEFDIDNARALLLKALNIAQKNNFDRLVLDLLSQQEKLTKQSIELRNLEKTSSTISQRMTVVDLNSTVSSIKRTSITETVKKEEHVSKKLFSIQI